MNNITSEKELISRASNFEEEALAEIYDLYSPGVYRYAMHLLSDSHLAEDCLADTFLRYLQSLRSHGGPRDHLQAYLYRIAHNLITDHYRRQPPSSLPLFEEISNEEDDLIQTIIDLIEKEKVQAALVVLTTEQRQVIVMKYLEGLDNKRIASILRKTIGSIKALQHRALDTLQRLLLP